MADALLQWGGWVHRRVESVHLLHGERGRRRNSIDCVPPPDPRLAYTPDERTNASIDDVEGLVMVPLAMVAKGPMRDLDVLDGDGRTMPVLGRGEDVQVALAALAHLWRKAVGDPEPAVLGALGRVVAGEATQAGAVAQALVGRGQVDGVTVVEAAAVPEVLALLVRDLADNFLLVGLLPAKRSGTRQVLKWSANWHIHPTPMTLRSRWFAAAGAGTVTLRIPSGGLSNTASYHLEVHMPAELESVSLALPEADDPAPGKTDATRNPVAHVFGSYPETPDDQDALLELAVPWRGLRMQAVFAAAFTAAVFALGLSLPHALPTLLGAGGGAAGLLLAAPGALMAVRAGAHENVVASQVLVPLRGLLYGFALLLTAAAGSIVGRLDHPWITCLWWTGLVVSAVPLVVFAWARFGSVGGHR